MRQPWESPQDDDEEVEGDDKWVAHFEKVYDSIGQERFDAMALRIAKRHEAILRKYEPDCELLVMLDRYRAMEQELGVK